MDQAAPAPVAAPQAPQGQPQANEPKAPAQSKLSPEESAAVAKHAKEKGSSAKSQTEKVKQAAKEEQIQGDAQNVSRETPEQKEARRIKFKAKIDGLEEDVDLDEADIQRMYQKWKASDKRFMESSQREKQVESLLNLLQTRPDLALRELGLDPDVLAEQRVIEKMKLEMMNPDQRRAFELEQQLRQLQSEREYQNQSRQEQEMQYHTEQAMQKVQADILQGLQAGELAPSAESVARVAQRLMAAHEAGIPMTMDEAISTTKTSAMKEFRHYITNMNGQQLANWLGEDVLKKVREYDLGRLKQVTPKPVVLDQQQMSQPDRKKHFITEKEWDNAFRRKFGGI